MRRLALVSVFAAFGFGAWVQVSYSGHYHTNCNGHGFVSGESPTDGSFFSRVEAGPCHDFKTCQLRLSDESEVSVEYGASAYASCNVWSRDFGNYVECYGRSDVELINRFNIHRHQPDNACG